MFTFASIASIAIVVLFVLFAAVLRARTRPFFVYGFDPRAIGQMVRMPIYFGRYVWSYASSSQARLSPYRLRQALAAWFRVADPYAGEDCLSLRWSSALVDLSVDQSADPQVWGLRTYFLGEYVHVAISTPNYGVHVYSRKCGVN